MKKRKIKVIVDLISNSLSFSINDGKSKQAFRNLKTQPYVLIVSIHLSHSVQHNWKYDEEYFKEVVVKII